MDLNTVVLCGRLAAQPEIRIFENGVTLLRVLITVRSEEPKRRVDVIPVTWWDPPAHVIEPGYYTVGDRLWAAGQLQRRFWASERGGRVSALEMVAHLVEIHSDETANT